MGCVHDSSPAMHTPHPATHVPLQPCMSPSPGTHAPPLDRYICENISFSQLRLRAVKTLIFPLYFKVTEKNRRRVLGDVIYLIRFPNIDADEFIRSVSSGEVLTTEESLSLILLMKGSTPKKKLTFSSVERGGAWTEEFFKDLSIVSQQTSFGEFGEIGTACTAFPSQSSPPGEKNVPFRVEYGKNKSICIKSVFLINNGNWGFSKVSLSDYEGKISKLENRTYVGCQLYEAVFNPKVIMQKSADLVKTPSPHSLFRSTSPTHDFVKLQSSITASIIIQQQCQPHLRQGILLQGQRTIGANPDLQSFAGTAQV